MEILWQNDNTVNERKHKIENNNNNEKYWRSLYRLKYKSLKKPTQKKPQKPDPPKIQQSTHTKNTHKNIEHKYINNNEMRITSNYLLK